MNIDSCTANQKSVFIHVNEGNVAWIYLIARFAYYAPTN